MVNAHFLLPITTQQPQNYIVYYLLFKFVHFSSIHEVTEREDPKARRSGRSVRF